MPHNPRQKSHPETLNAIDRRRRALQYRLNGLTYDQIVDKLKVDMGDRLPKSYDNFWCWRDVDLEIREYRKEIKETVADLIELDLKRLDKLFTIAMENAESGSMKAVLTALKIMERRSKLLGMDKPALVQVRDWRSEILDLLKAGRITLDEVKKEIGDDMFKSLLESSGFPQLPSGDIVDGVAVEVKEKEQVTP